MTQSTFKKHEPSKQELIYYIGRRISAPFRSAPSEASKVFCISSQRCGTTSVGRFCRDQLGLTHRGYRHTLVNHWTRQWTEANYPDAQAGAMEAACQKIFGSADFRMGQIFEDDPWWLPGMPEILATAFPTARFVMLTRPADEWFQSMIKHSQGRSLGFTDTHALIYDRWAEYQDALSQSKSADDVLFNGLSMEGMDAHYTRQYRERTEKIMNYFSGKSNFFHAELSDPNKFTKLASFLGYDGSFKGVWANKSAAKSSNGV